MNANSRHILVCQNAQQDLFRFYSMDCVPKPPLPPRRLAVISTRTSVGADALAEARAAAEVRNRARAPGGRSAASAGGSPAWRVVRG